MTEEDDRAPITEGTAEYAWEIVMGILEERITSGRLRYGDRLPPRQRLAEELHVGEQTVRRALRELAERGMVRGMGSRGTVVIWHPGDVH